MSFLRCSAVLLLLLTCSLRAQFIAFNDHAPGPGTAANTTTYDVLGDAATSGALKDINTGLYLPALLTITRTPTGVAGAGTQGSPAPGTPLYDTFNGFVDFQGTPNPSIELTGSGMVTYTFTGLDPSKRYSFKGSAVRGNAAYTDRWTLFEIVGADSFTSAHTAHVLTTAQVPALTASQAAINTGINNTADTGDMAAWDNINPGADGSFAVTCQQYTGTVPGGSSGGIKGYGMTGIRLEEIDITATPVAITSQPQSQTVDERQPATFTVTATGNPAPTYQWFKDAFLIPGATSASYTLAAAPLKDDGAQFTVVVSNTTDHVAHTLTSDAAILHVRADTTPPQLLSVQPFGLAQLNLTFSEPVAPSGATNPANYTISGGPQSVVISNAVLDASQTNVLLTVSPMEEGSAYTILLSGITDQSAAANPLAAGTQATFRPGAFTPADIGAPALTGTLNGAQGGYDLVGGGTDIGGTSDQFFFAQQQLTNDFDVQVRVNSVDAINTWTKAGLMARVALTGTSPFAAVLTTPSLPGTFFEARATSGTAAALTQAIPVNHPATWLRLQRRGNLLTGFGSFDGQTWKQLGVVNTTLPKNIFVGMAVASHDSNRVATAQFREFGPTTTGTLGTVARPMEVLGPSTRKTGLVISEIMYRPAPRTDGLNLEFIEVFNSNPFFEDLSGYRLGGQIDFTFPPGTILGGGGFLVVAAAPADVQRVYGLSNVLGPYSNSLRTHGGDGLVQLLDKIGSVLLNIPYSKNPPWPVAADATGHSLVLARPSYGEGDARAWATSDVVGGSPGTVNAYRPGPARSVVINEILAVGDSTRPSFIELYNRGLTAADISGCVLTVDPTANQFIIAAGTFVPAGGFVAFDQSQTGMQLNPAGQTLFFKDKDGTRILDALSFEGQAPGVSFGRFPDGAGEFYPLTTATAGTHNGPILIRDIVINEIMYKPISGDENDEYVELYNKGANPVDLSSWRFTSGIKFTFPTGTVLAPDAYLVVGKNVTNLLAHYSNLTANNTVGPFSGKLAGSGERLVLSMPTTQTTTTASGALATNTVMVAADEVTYGTGGRWGRWANGGGSSLELINPRANHRLAANWADSDETQKAPWTIIESTGRLDLGANYEARIAHFQVGLLDTGECLVDNIDIHSSTNPTNVAFNPDFESGLAGWTLQGDHVYSSLENSGYQSATALHLRCTDRVWTGANSAQGILTNSTLAAGQTGTLHFAARWLRGSPDVLLRLNGNWLEATGSMLVPPNLGTPGARNSRAVANTPPAIHEVTHTPSLPAAGERVVVTARLDDPDALQTVLLHYRVDPSGTDTLVTMTDDGTGGDLLAGDGIYSAAIPGKPANTVVAFYIEAVASSGASARFPALKDDNTPVRECLVMFGDTIPISGFGTYHHWLTQANIAQWSSLPDLSNQSFDGTFVYGPRVIYNMAAHYAGSPYHEQFDSPIGGLCHYKWDFPEDDQFLGTTSFNKIHQPGNGPGDDDTLQREQTFYWIARQLGLPWNYRRFVAVYVNGRRRGPLMEDTQVPDGDVVKEHFPDDNNGDLFKLQPWFEFDAGGRSFNNQSWCMLNNYTTVGGEKKLARYRWNFLARKNSVGPNNYTNVFALADAANHPANSQAFIDAMDSAADMEEWMRTFAASHSVGDWDHVGTQNAQNMYGYKPTQGKWTLFLWDCNILLGNSGCWSPGQNLLTYTSGDQGMSHIYGTFVYKRALWRAFKEIAQDIMDPSRVNPVVDAKYAAFVSEAISATSSTTIKNWIASARKSILSQVNTAGGNTAFDITTSDGTTTSDNSITLTGFAPVEVKTVAINGVSYPVSWTSTTQWNATVPLNPGLNSLVAQGYNLSGAPVTGANQSVQIIYNDPNQPAILGVSSSADQTITLTWTAQAGKTYRVQSTDTLAQPLWSALPDVTASAETASITDSTPAPVQRYYRVLLLNP